MVKSVKYFNKEKRMLKIVGLSFTGDESPAYRIYSFLIVFFANFMYPVLEFRELFTHDIEVVSNMLIYIFSMYVGLAKTIVVLRNRIRFGKMLEKLEKVPFAVDLERGGLQEQKINEDCLWITNAQTMAYWTVGFSTMIGAIIYTLIKRIRSSDYRDWELAYGPLEILNVTYSPNYEITWFYQNVSIIIIGAHFTTIDLLMASLLAHISYQFRMLQNNIRRITVNCYIEMQKNKIIALQGASSMYADVSRIPWEYLHKHLKKTIEYHVEIDNLAKEMEQVFSQLLLLVFLGTLGILCFSIYRSSVIHDNLNILIHMFEALTSCLQVLAVCFWGEQVMFESQQVGRAAYESDFVGTNVRFQKGLVMIIRRSQNPSKLTAGKFTEICLATFTWIMRTSYSAFMVVRSSSSNSV